MYDAVFVYDGDCPYCSAASKALRRISDVGAVSWNDDAAQDFLRAQFGEVPFAMFLVDSDEDTVYAGKAAAEELADRAGMPDVVSRLVGDEYDRIETLVGFATRRERETEDYHEVYEMTDGARDSYEELASAAGDLPFASTG